jgi:hypothetical protein
MQPEDNRQDDWTNRESHPALTVTLSPGEGEGKREAFRLAPPRRATRQWSPAAPQPGHAKPHR